MSSNAATPPPRIALAQLPTPLQSLPSLGESLGVELFIKRDDLTGSALSGNKVRKLEYLFAEARDAGADTVVSCGGEQSNHCRATALCAARCGMRSVLLLRTADPDTPPAVGGNILLDRLVGAEIRWITADQYERRDELLAEEAERLRARGAEPYVIPEGGSNACGTWGYVRAAAELAEQTADWPDGTTTILHAVGSGGTSAGLLIGVRRSGLAERGFCVAGVNVGANRDYFVDKIAGICADFNERWPQAGPVIRREDVEIIDGYVGEGYAISRDEELALIRDVARGTGNVLDPVYTGKAFYGLTRELERDRGRFGDRVIFVHTGGIYGLFPKAEQLAPLL